LTRLVLSLFNTQRGWLLSITKENTFGGHCRTQAP